MGHHDPYMSHETSGSRVRPDKGLVCEAISTARAWLTRDATAAARVAHISKRGCVRAHRHHRGWSPYSKVTTRKKPEAVEGTRAVGTRAMHGHGRVRGSASDKRTCRSAGGEVPAGWPTGESNPTASTIAGGGTPAVGLERSGQRCCRGARSRRRSTSGEDPGSTTRDRSGTSGIAYCRTCRAG